MTAESAERRFLRIVSGEASGVGPSLARAGLSILEPAYAAAVALRNKSYDWGVKRTLRLPRPVISVGNVTTGGTGKTPVVAWLAKRYLQVGRRPAVLTRGYRKRGATISDEAEMLREALGGEVPILVGGDRHAAASAALARGERIDLFIMDDGFQHRRLHRDFDLVLIDATRPFGFDHVLPRGLLRERPSSLRRASAILITRADLGDARPLSARLRSFAPAAPVFACSHAMRTLDLRREALALAGIANPRAFESMLRGAGMRVVQTAFYPDHHEYGEGDVADVVDAARRAGAGVIVTTSKDWTKLKRVVEGCPIPVVVAELEIRFNEEDEDRLFELIRSRIGA